MFDRSYLKASGQLWKLGVFFACPLVALSLIIGAFTAFPNHEQLAIIMVLSGVLLGLLGLVWASLAITCRQCKARLFWLAVKSQAQSNWMAWLLSLERCPKCDLKPSENGNRGSPKTPDRL